jgi:hypothetical protein
MPTSHPSRIIMRLELSPTAKQSFIASSDRLGMTQIATTSRIIQWLIDQDEEVIAAVLDIAPQELRVDPAIKSLKRLAGKKL